MTATARKRAGRNEMLATERKKLVKAIAAAVAGWRTCGYARAVGRGWVLQTHAGELEMYDYTEDSLGGSPWIAMCFQEPARAAKLGLDVPANGKWNFYFFGRQMAADAIRYWHDCISRIIGPTQDYTDPPPVFTPKPLPPRDLNYVSPFEGETVELCSECLRNFTRPRDCTSALCLRCAWAELEDKRQSLEVTEAEWSEATDKVEAQEGNLTAANELIDKLRGYFDELRTASVRHAPCAVSWIATIDRYGEECGLTPVLEVKP